MGAEVEEKGLDRKKLLDFMDKRFHQLEDQIVRDFSGDIQSRLFEWREVKFWKEAIERGEFDKDDETIYIIMCECCPSLVEHNYYTDEKEVQKRVDELNKMAHPFKYWYIRLGRKMTKVKVGQNE